jgi:hypothetical protein
MRDFTAVPGRLRKLQFHARLVYSVFAISCLIAVGLTGWLTDDMVGLTLDGYGEYYAGEIEELDLPPEPIEDMGGPSFDLPPEADEIVSEGRQMPLRKLLEITHFHLFSMPVYLLILCHLYMLSRDSNLVKNIWISIASLGTIFHVLAPWLARSGSMESKIFFAISGAAMAISYTYMCILPLWEMWGPIPKKKRKKLEPWSPA